MPALAGPLHADPIRVAQTQGTAHGFLWLRSESGEVLAHGDLFQSVHGSRVISELVFHFKDGSLDDETTTYSQLGTFKLIRDHHIQRGPWFPKPLDLTVDADGQVTTRSLDKGGKEKVETQHLDLPPDISNGMVQVLLLNVRKDTAEFHLSMVAPASKGRLVKLNISPDGPAHFEDVGVQRTATVFRIRIDIGGVAGVVAPIIGKQPADILVWVDEGVAPQLIREVGQLYEGGPTVSIELSGATFPRVAAPSP